MRKLLALFAVSFALLTNASGTQSVTLAWDPNVEPVDGYRLYYGVKSRSYFRKVEVLAPTTQATVTGLEPGATYYFAVTAFILEPEELESDFSDEVVYTVPGDIRPPQPLLYSVEKGLIAWFYSPVFDDFLEYTDDFITWTEIRGDGTPGPRRGDHYVYEFLPTEAPYRFFRLRRTLK